MMVVEPDEIIQRVTVTGPTTRCNSLSESHRTLGERGQSESGTTHRTHSDAIAHLRHRLRLSPGDVALSNSISNAPQRHRAAQTPSTRGALLLPRTHTLRCTGPRSDHAAAATRICRRRHAPRPHSATGQHPPRGAPRSSQARSRRPHHLRRPMRRLDARHRYASPLEARHPERAALTRPLSPARPGQRAAA